MARGWATGGGEGNGAAGFRAVDRRSRHARRWRIVTDFVVGQRVRVMRATGRDDVVEGDVGRVFGYARFTLRVRFLPGVILPISPTMVEVIREASSADQPPA